MCVTVVVALVAFADLAKRIGDRSDVIGAGAETARPGVTAKILGNVEPLAQGPETLWVRDQGGRSR